VTTASDNKAVVRRFLDALGAGDVAGAAACFDAERYYSHAWEGDLAVTWEKMKARRRAGTLTDWESETVALVGDDDRVVHHSHAWCTDANTGRRVDVHTLEIWRVENALIVEHWGGLREYERFQEQLS